MQRHPECSFSEHMASISELSRKEQSILKEYQKLQYSEETPQYSIETMNYAELPSFFPADIKKTYSQCIFLDRFTFYEMFTMLIFEYLCKDVTESKLLKLNALKTLICEPDFLEGNFYIKGLLLKGLKEI